MIDAAEIEIPEAFARGTIAREGERGARWLDTLPALVADLLERWGCALDGPIMHGAVGLIVPVLRGVPELGDMPNDKPDHMPDHMPSQQRSVLKVSFPHPGNVAEPYAFAAWGGNGAVRLYERADESYAMLLERADTHTLAELSDTREIVRVAGMINRRLAVPADSLPGLTHLRDRALEWAELLQREATELPDVLPRRVVDTAVATLREIGADQPEFVLHGDLHPLNILSAEREPWLAVDPKGYAGDPAYDAGTLLKSLRVRLVAEDDLDKAVLRALADFAEAAELDPERVRRWTQFHAVETAFWARRNGFQRSSGTAWQERGGRRGQIKQRDQVADLLGHFAELLA
jgi:streptomycin 6-kinase